MYVDYKQGIGGAQSARLVCLHLLASALSNYRTDWQYQNFLMERMLKGFPLNEEEVDSYGQPIAAQMGTKGDGTLKTLLGAGGKSRRADTSRRSQSGQERSGTQIG